MKNTMRIVNSIVTAVTGLTVALIFVLGPAFPAGAADAWKSEFEDVCSKVDVSQDMSIKDLEALIARADKLNPEIQKSDDPAKKIYLKRLKNCRSIFEFAIDTKKNSGK